MVNLRLEHQPRRLQLCLTPDHYLLGFLKMTAILVMQLKINLPMKILRHLTAQLRLMTSVTQRDMSQMIIMGSEMTFQLWQKV